MDPAIRCYMSAQEEAADNRIAAAGAASGGACDGTAHADAGGAEAVASGGGTFGAPAEASW